MQTITTQLKDSGARLKDTGNAFATTTRKATQTFVGASVDATKEAYEALVAALTEASAALVGEAKGASTDAVEALAAELDAWRSLVAERADTLALPSPELNLNLDGLPTATQLSAQVRVAPKNAEEQLLKAVQRVLEDVGTRVDTRLDSLGKAPAASLPATTKAKKAKSTKSAKAAKTVKAAKPAKASAPLRGYDAMTAREVAQKVQSATLAKVEAIGTYERATKNRTTVLRAVASRVA